MFPSSTGPPYPSLPPATTRPPNYQQTRTADVNPRFGHVPRQGIGPGQFAASPNPRDPIWTPYQQPRTQHQWDAYRANTGVPTQSYEGQAWAGFGATGNNRPSGFGDENVQYRPSASHGPGSGYANQGYMPGPHTQSQDSGAVGGSLSRSRPAPTVGHPVNAGPSSAGSAVNAGPSATNVGDIPLNHRRASTKDEFDGPRQLLPWPDDLPTEVSESQLVVLPISLQSTEQDEVLTQVNDCLSRCAFNFVAKHQFPIPVEPDKRPVQVPGDREWTEWCHLLRRLATKRRIPTRVLWNGQIKQLVTVLENSMEMRHAAMHQSRPLKDDRNILQLISAGLQVAKMLKDPDAMVFLDRLYVQTETMIGNRKRQI